MQLKAFDEECLLFTYPREDDGNLWRRRSRRLRPSRFSKPFVVLLIIDIIIVWLLVLAFQPLISLLVRNDQLFGARLALTNHFQPAVDTRRKAKPTQIPRILHQTAPTAQLSTEWAAAQDTCRTVYADFEYILWTDQVARDFIAKHYPWFLTKWDTYPFPIQRADAIRYFILYHYGGLYLDMDTICTKQIPVGQIETQTAPTHSAVFKSTTPTGVSNDFLASTAHHPAFGLAISRLSEFHSFTQSWAWLLPHISIMVSAGPFFLTWILKQYILEQGDLLTPWAVQVINSTQLDPYLIDLEAQSWHHADTGFVMWLGKNPALWYVAGAIGLLVVLSVLNNLLLAIWSSTINGKLMWIVEKTKQRKIS